jgi:hypothetical protein
MLRRDPRLVKAAFLKVLGRDMALLFGLVWKGVVSQVVEVSIRGQ